MRESGDGISLLGRGVREGAAWVREGAAWVRRDWKVCREISISLLRPVSGN